MIVSIIVAMDINRGIGKDNQTPWHISSDLKRFKKITMGHHIIMGRKTYESINQKLPGRKMIILTRHLDYEVEGAVVLHSLENALRYAEDHGESEVYIVGGGDIFEQSMKYADRMYLTIVDASVEADVFFPPYNDEEWAPIHCEFINFSNGDQYSYTYQVLQRKQEPGD